MIEYPIILGNTARNLLLLSVFFTLKIDTKDNKARVTFSDMSIKVPANSMMEAFEIEVKSQADKTNVEQTLKQIISTFQTSVQQASVDTNW